MIKTMEKYKFNRRNCKNVPFKSGIRLNRVRCKTQKQSEGTVSEKRDLKMHFHITEKKLCLLTFSLRCGSAERLWTVTSTCSSCRLTELQSDSHWHSSTSTHANNCSKYITWKKTERKNCKLSGLKQTGVLWGGFGEKDSCTNQGVNIFEHINIYSHEQKQKTVLDFVFDKLH